MSRLTGAVRLVAARWWEQRSIYQEVRRYSAHLRRGLYVRQGMTVWRHWRVHMPPHLAATKGSMTPEGTITHRVRHTLSRLIPFVHRPILVVRDSGSSTSYPIVVAAAGRGVVLLDPDKRLVGRPVPGSGISTAQMALREAWGAHVPSPRFHVDGRRRWIEEEFVPGAALRSLDGGAQIATIKRLMSSYTALAAATARASSEHLMSASRDASARRADLPGFAHLGAADVLPWVRALPLVPTPVDHAAGNVIIRPNGETIVIDSFPMAWLPLYYYPLALMTSKTTLRGLRSAYFAGEFDEDLEALFESGGARFQRDPQRREALVAMSLLAHAVARTANAASSQATVDGFLRDSLRVSGLGDPSAWPSHALPRAGG